MITIIVAAAADGAIGKGGDLLWHLSGDLKRFKEITLNHAVVMGRKTWESLPKRPLPDRLNVVISSNKDYDAPGAVVATSLDEGLDLAFEHDGEESEVFVIGGASIYRQALPLADAMDFTLVEATFPDADAWFEIPDKENWEIVDESPLLHDDKSGLDFRHQILLRKS